MHSLFKTNRSKIKLEIKKRNGDEKNEKENHFKFSI